MKIFFKCLFLLSRACLIKAKTAKLHNTFMHDNDDEEEEIFCIQI